MKEVDIVVVGGGVGGICAALAASRLYCRTLLIEKKPKIGGTAFYSPVALICKFRDHMGRVINNGIQRELFPEAYQNSGLYFDEEKVPVYDEEIFQQRCVELTAAEPYLEIWTESEVTEVHEDCGTIQSVVVTGKHQELVSAKVFLDGTADGNLSVLAGADFEQGRPVDHKTQTATLTFICKGIDTSKLKNPDLTTWGSHYSIRSELDVYYKKAKELNETTNHRNEVLCFPTLDGKGLLFNSTSVVDVDATDERSLYLGTQEGRKQVEELMQIIRRHPAFSKAQIEKISSCLGIRESRRIIGDYQLTAEDCLSARKFSDMVAACAYELDIHDPDGKLNSKLQNIPYPGYYHIPYRCLIAKGFQNLLLSSRCISGTHEAHSSYRVMSGVTAIGQAAGTAAALCVKEKKTDVRKVRVENIRYILQTRGQFVEGKVMFTKLPYCYNESIQGTD